MSRTSGCNSTQSAKSASAIVSSAFLGRSLTATLTLPGTVKDMKDYFSNLKAIQKGLKEYLCETNNVTVTAVWNSFLILTILLVGEFDRHLMN